MGKLLGLLVFLIGLGLLTLSLCVPPILLPQSAWMVIWRAGLGFVLCVAGYVMASYSGADARFVASDGSHRSSSTTELWPHRFSPRNVR